MENENMDDLKYFHNPEPVCPHCDAVLRDAWELNFYRDEETEVDCGTCEKPYTINRDITITYSTTPTTKDEAMRSGETLP